jgi:hypothetical protein
MARLFETFEDLKPYVSSANVNNSIATLESHIEQAWEKYMIPYLGRTFGESICTKYDANTLDSNERILLKKIQMPLANFAYLLYAKDGGLTIDDGGITTSEDGQNKRPYQWQVRDFKNNRLNQGWQGMRTMLDHLSTNKATFTTWWSSDERNYLWSLVIWDAFVFNKYRKIENQGVVDALLPYLGTAKKEIIANLGDFGTEAIAWCQSRATNAAMSNLLPYLENFAVWASLTQATQDIHIEIGPNGLYLNETNQGLQNDDSRKNIVQQQQNHLNQVCANNKKAALAALINYLNTNAAADTYATWYGSDLYNAEIDAALPIELFDGPTFFM